MKKRILSIFAGTLALLLLLTAAAGAFAKGGKVAFNQVNLAVFGNQKIAAGETFRTAGGAQAPSTITYTDETGVDTTYVPVRMMAELLDAKLSWDNETKTADFAAKSTGLSNVTLSVSSDVEESELGSETPQLDVQAGPFTEIAPAASKQNGRVLLDHAGFRSLTGLKQFYYIDPEIGDYVEIEVTNHGAPVRFKVDRPILLSGSAAVDQFSTVRLDTGKTLTRAFRMSETDVELQRLLRLIVDTAGTRKEADITVHITQYAQWSES